MRKLLFPLFSLVVLAGLVLAACGPPVTPATQATVPTQEPAATEAPSTTEAPATGAETPVATEPPAAGDATPTTAAAEEPAPPVAGGERLQAILDRGQVICGVHGTFQGFGFVDSAGEWTGFDVDFCRAWAAALFNDAAAVEFRGLSAQERFTALQSGEVDVLARNSTWTWSRDVELGLTFGPVNFYDGQAIMAKTEIVTDPAAGVLDNDLAAAALAAPASAVAASGFSENRATIRTPSPSGAPRHCPPHRSVPGGTAAAAPLGATRSRSPRRQS